MSKASWINKEGYYTIFYLIRSGLDLSEIARVTHRGYKTVKRANSYLNRAYNGTLAKAPLPNENASLRSWALEFARTNPPAKTTKQPAPKEMQKPVQPKLSGEKQALFLTLFFSELFYLAASGDTSLPFPPVSYGEKDAAFLAYRLGGVRTAVYAMDYETEYLKWRKSVLGEYDIDEQLGGECHEED